MGGEGGGRRQRREKNVGHTAAGRRERGGPECGVGGVWLRLQSPSHRCRAGAQQLPLFLQTFPPNPWFTERHILALNRGWRSQQSPCVNPVSSSPLPFSSMFTSFSPGISTPPTNRKKPQTPEWARDAKVRPETSS